MSTRKPARRYEEVDVTPKMAAGWLENMIENNRRERRRITPKYARDMAAEVPADELKDTDPATDWGVRIERGPNGRAVSVPCRWLVTGDTLKIDPDERLWDGGQRLRALGQAKELNPNLVSIRMVVAYNMPAAGIRVTDRGAKRTFAETLRIEGLEHYETVSGAIVRRIALWEQGNYADARGGNSGFGDPTDTELLVVFRKNILLIDAAARRGQDVRQQGLGTTTAAGVAYFLLNRIDDQECKGFFENLVAGAGDGITERSPVWQLRERLRKANDRYNRYESLTTTQQLYLYCKAWNHFRHDYLVERLQLPKGGVTNANFVLPE